MTHRLAVLAALIALVGCGEPISQPGTERGGGATVSSAARGAGTTSDEGEPIQTLGTCRGALGDSTYCGPDCPCAEGEGDCDSNAECMPGLVCAFDVGVHYGWDAEVDVCQSACSRVGDDDYDCTPECPCAEGEGDCDTDADCGPDLWCLVDAGPSYGYDDPNVDVCVAGCPDVGVGAGNFCNPACPCAVGEGDCDKHSDCEPGLLCKRDVGASYGWDREVDVCEPGPMPAEARIAFPPPMSFTTASTITVRGKAFDWNRVVAVRVNGIAAHSSNDFIDWQASVPLTRGRNTLSVEVEDGRGDLATDLVQVEVHMAPGMLHDPRAVAWDAAGKRALVLADTLNTLLAVDGATGAISVIGRHDFGPGAPQGVPRALAWDGASRAFVLEQGKLFAVDAATGARALLSGAGAGAGADLSNAQSMQWDAAHQRLVVVASHPSRVVAVDATTGDRTLLSGSYVGAGPGFSYPSAIALDEAANRAFVVDNERVLAVDLGTGNRSIVFDGARAGDPAVAYMRAVAWDAAGGRLLILDAGEGTLVAVDVATGAHRLVSGKAEDPGLITPDALVWDAAAGRALVVDMGRDALLAIDGTTGARTVLAELAVGAGAKMRTPESMTWDPRDERVLVADLTPRSLVAVDVGTGDRAVLTENTAPAIFPLSITWDALGERVLAVDTSIRALVGIDVITGARALVSGAGVGFGPPLNLPKRVVWNPASNRAAVLDPSLRTVFEIDATTGARAVLSSFLRGKGPGLGTPLGMTWDQGNTRLLVSDVYYPAVLGIDAATGNRTILADNRSGGPALQQPRALAWDRVRDRALLLDYTPAKMLALDVSTGARTVLTDFRTGEGPVLTGPSSLLQPPGAAYILVADRNLGLLAAVDGDTGERVIVSH